MTPKTLIIRTAGTNCDLELEHAFQLAGATTQAMHLNTLLEQPEALNDFDILGIPGGFSYGDDIAAGRILAGRLRHRLMTPLLNFIQAGKPVIGICNGFQVLVKTGLLPGFDLANPDANIDPQGPPQTITLTDNTLPRFVDKWTPMQVPHNSNCIWTQGLSTFDLPIAHGEGRFIADDSVLDQLEAQNQIALRYTDNPNGSLRDIAGIADPSGLVLGLMPHPERFTHPTHHPTWTRQPNQPVDIAGLKMFQNAVNHVQSQVVNS